MKPGSAPPPADAQSAPTFRGLRNLAEKTSPWLTDVGSWIFGGLTAVNLVVISALITVGPVDAAIRTSTAALTAALPLNVAGIILLPSPLERVSQHETIADCASLFDDDRRAEHCVDADGNDRGHMAHGPVDCIRAPRGGGFDRSPCCSRGRALAAAKIGRRKVAETASER